MTDVRTVVDAAAAALDDLGLNADVTNVQPVGGGCIHNGARLDTADAPYFLKWSPNVPAGMFEREAEGLEALRAPGQLRVPEVIGHGASDTGAWLLLEYLEPSSSTPDSDERLGHGLALIHESATEDEFGWPTNNWIGNLPQSNDALASWGAFWRDRRIAPQLERARERGYCTEAIFDRLIEVVAAGLADVASPDLLHGDLWGGNTFTTPDGEPVLIDPAVYHGHGEVDLAMSELFGGFGPGFQGGYSDVRPITGEYRAYRCDLYQLYYLLVHVNLFGAAYVSGSLAAASRVVSELT